MLQLFGLILPAAPTVADRATAHVLARRMADAVEVLRAGAPGAVAGGVRLDARRYLRARQEGALQLSPGAIKQCDELAWALMSLTLDAPPIVTGAEPLVA